MLRTRLWIGAVLILMMVAVLYFDLFLAPFFPILGILIVVVGFLAVVEMRGLLPTALRPNPALALLAVELVLISPWLALAANRLSPSAVTINVASHWSLYLFAAAIRLAFLVEM